MSKITTMTSQAAGKIVSTAKIYNDNHIKGFKFSFMAGLILTHNKPVCRTCKEQIQIGEKYYSFRRNNKGMSSLEHTSCFDGRLY